MAAKSIHPPIKIGQPVGYLTIKSRAFKVRNHQYWHCLCHCGKTFPAREDHLRHEKIRSCGCMRGKLISLSKITHGKAGSVEYYLWNGMISRTTNPKDSNFQNYGARGITICDRWRTSFAAFYEDVGPRPSPKHSIERKDNNLGYSPDNVIWGTREEQANNKRNVQLFLFQGKNLSLKQWSRELGIKYGTLRRRIRAGYSLERAFSKKTWKENYLITYEQRTASKLHDHAST